MDRDRNYLSNEEINQIVRQVTQAVTQQVAEQVTQAAQQTAGSMAADKKILGYTSNTEDTQTDEAVRGKTYTDSEMWGFNKKLLVASEQTERQRSLDHESAVKALELKERQLAVAEREAKLRQQASLDNLHLRSAEQAELIKHMSNHLHLDFRATVNESQLPMLDDDQSVKNESK